MKKLLPFLILTGVSPAHASTYQGVVQELDIAAVSSGGTRVSVLTSGTTSCRVADNHWYLFEYSSQSGPGPEWLAALLSAKITRSHDRDSRNRDLRCFRHGRVAELDLP